MTLRTPTRPLSALEGDLREAGSRPETAVSLAPACPPKGKVAAPVQNRGKRPSRLPCPSEHEECLAFATWMRTRGILFRRGADEGPRRRGFAGRLRAEGWEAGWPDYCVLMTHGLVAWIEMKRQRGGVLSEPQKACHERLRALGHRVYVARGAEDAIQWLVQEGFGP